MIWLPIVGRELRVAARRSGTYWLRFWAALGVLILYFIILCGNLRRPSQTASKQIFGFLTALLGLACLFSGIFQTADCLSEEKREGTMGLLFLTDLRGYDIVLGKLAVSSLRVFYGLLSALPVLALPLMMGGVSGAQFWRVVLVLVTTMFFSLGLGMAVSAFNRDGRQVIGITIFVILLLTGIFPALNGVFNLLFSSRRLFRPLLWPSSGYALTHAFDAFYQTSTGRHDFWGSLLVILAFGIISLALACLVLPRAWQETGRAESGGKIAGAWNFLRYGGPLDRRRARQWLEVNPFEWLGRRDRLAPWSFWILAFPILVLWIILELNVGSPTNGPKMAEFEMMMYLSLGLQLVLKCIITTEVCRRLNDDRRSGALELLLVTTLDDKRIISGLGKALARQFIVPLAVIAGAFGIMTRLAMASDSLIYLSDVVVVMMIGNMCSLLPDCVAIGQVGMWEGLRAKNHARAVVATLAKLLFLPWLFYIIIGECGGFNSKGEVFLAFWFAAGLLNDAFWALRARNRLQHSFRIVAAGSR